MCNPFFLNPTFFFLVFQMFQSIFAIEVMDCIFIYVCVLLCCLLHKLLVACLLLIAQRYNKIPALSMQTPQT